MRKNSLLIPIILLACITTARAQNNRFEIGGKVINELADWRTYAPGIGLQAIWRITKHSGLESGIYYKQNPKYYLFMVGMNEYRNLKYTEQDIMLPVLYRFDSKSVNFTAGFALDYFVNFENLQKNPPLGLDASVLSRWEVLSTLSVSKNFYLKNKWIIEPEIRASAFVPAGGGGVGLNISFRKKLY